MAVGVRRPRKGTYSSPLEAIRRLLQEYPESVVAVHEKFMQKLWRENKHLLEGTVSTRELRRMGHPYARRHPVPLLPPLPINRQSGRLIRGRKIVVQRGPRQARVWLTFEDVPYAKYILSPTGTRKMHARPFLKRITDYQRRERPRFVEREYQKLLRKHGIGGLI